MSAAYKVNGDESGKAMEMLIELTRVDAVVVVDTNSTAYGVGRIIGGVLLFLLAIAVVVALIRQARGR